MGFFSREKKPCGCAGEKEIKKQRTNQVETWKGKDLEESVDVFIGIVPSWPCVRLLRAVREIDIKDGRLYKSLVKTTYLDYFCEECEDVFRIENSVNEEKDFDMDKIDEQIDSEFSKESEELAHHTNPRTDTDVSDSDVVKSDDLDPESSVSDESVKQKILEG